MTWEEINRKRLPFIRMGDRLFRLMYSEIRSELKASLKNLTTPEEITQAARNVQIKEDQIRGYYERFYIRTGVAFAKYQQKGTQKPIEYKNEDVWAAKIKETVRTKTAKKITKVIQTAYEDIQNITKIAVETGIEEGWGMDKIARAIVKQQGEIDLWKALRIARTEVVAASSEGIKIGAEEIPGDKVKVWISTFDERSRPEHMAMDGVRVPLNESFNVDGDMLEYPGDSNGKPENITNCRCGYEIVRIN